MTREDRFLLVVFLVAITLALFGLWFDAANAQGSDVPSVCQQPDNPTQFVFHIPTEWNNPDLPSWWVLGEGYSMQDTTTIIVDALTTVEIYGEGFPQWEQDLRPGQALVGSGDYATILVGDEKTAVCRAMATITPTPDENAGNGQVAINEGVVSTGRTCTIQYPKIILVCRP